MPIDVQDAEILKAKFKLAKQKEIHFAFGASTAPEKNVFVLHDKLSGEKLAKEVRSADKVGKLGIGTRISFGTARLEGTELVLTTEAPVSKMRKGVRGCLKTGSITVQAVRLRSVDGTEFPEDEEDGAETVERGPLGQDVQDDSIEEGLVEESLDEDGSVDGQDADEAEDEPSAERFRERFEAVKPVLQAAARADKDLAGELSGHFKAYSAALASEAWEECEAALAAMDAAAGPALRRRIEEGHVGPHLERVAKDSPTNARKHRQTIDAILARAQEAGRLGAILAGFEDGTLDVGDMTGGLKGGMWGIWRHVGRSTTRTKVVKQRRYLHQNSHGTYNQFRFPTEETKEGQFPVYTRGYEIPNYTDDDYSRDEKTWNFDTVKNFHGIGLDDIVALAASEPVILNSDPSDYSSSAALTTHGNIDFTKGKVSFEMPSGALKIFEKELGLEEVGPQKGQVSDVGAKDFAKIYAKFLKNVGAAEKITQVRLHACYSGFVGAGLLKAMREAGLTNLKTLYAPMGRVSAGAQSEQGGGRGKKIYVGVPSQKAVLGEAPVTSNQETEFVFSDTNPQYGLDDFVEKEDPPEHPLIRGFHVDEETGEIVADELPEQFRYLDRAKLEL